MKGNHTTHHPYILYEREDREPQMFRTFTEAALATGCNRYSIMRNCEGMYKETRKGKFRYIKRGK